MVLSIAVFANDAEAAGLVWRAINKTGSLISDLGDVAYCTVNGAPLEYQSSNSTWICGALKQNISEENQNNGYAGLGSTGQLQVAQMNGTFFNEIVQMPTGTATILNSNQSGTAEIKSLTQGTGITITNGSSTITIASTITQGFTAINPAYTTSDASLINANASNSATIKNLKAGTGISLTNNTDHVLITSTITQGFTNITPVQTSTNATIIASNSTNSAVFKNLSGVNGTTIGNGTNTLQISYDRIVSLNANATSTTSNIGSMALVFDIPLTASSGNSVSGILVAVSNSTGNAVQVAGNVTQATTLGYCSFFTPNGTSGGGTMAFDNIVLTSTLSPTDTAETTWFAGSGVPVPIQFNCGMYTGATPGDLTIWVQPEAVNGLATITTGSHYIKTP